MDTPTRLREAYITLKQREVTHQIVAQLHQPNENMKVSDITTLQNDLIGDVFIRFTQVDMTKDAPTPETVYVAIKPIGTVDYTVSKWSFVNLSELADFFNTLTPVRV